MRTVARIATLIFFATLALFKSEAARTQEYEFKGGYPTPQTIQRAYDDADLNRAIQAYKFFYPIAILNYINPF